MTVVEQKLETRPRILAVNRSRSVRASVDRSIGGRFDLYHVTDADSGWQALLNHFTIRAVIVNLSELALDGYNLIQLIRSSRITRIRELPVVVMSTHGHENADVLIQSLRVAEFITLAMSAAELNARLDALVHPPRTPRPAPEAGTPGIAESAPAPPEPESRTAAGTVADAESPDPAAPAQAPPDEPESQLPSLEKESQMSRLDNLKKVLKNLQSQSPGVEASALISEDGLMIASALSQDLDDTRVAGMTATLLNLGTRAATELRRGDVKEVIVRGDEGYAVMINAGRGALLLVLANETTPLGLIFFDMREAIKFIKNIL